MALPIDGASQPGQLGAGELVTGQVEDGTGLEQVGNHVPGEPDIALVAARAPVSVRGGAAGRQHRDQQPPSQSVSHHPPWAAVDRSARHHRRVPSIEGVSARPSSA